MLYNVKSMDMGGNPPGQQGAEGQQRPEPPQGSELQQRPEPPQGSEPQQRPEVRQNSQENTGDQPFSLLDSNEMPDFNPPSDTDRTMFQRQMGEMNNMERNFGGRGIRGSSGGSLEYIDDNIDSYSAIFNNVVGKGAESGYKRVVKAIKALSEGEELETYFDVDKILRYLAAHTIVVNLDSYSSSMAQNYYIYEREGKITILPWDYNLAWGGFQNGSASSVINFPIDTPVSGVEMSSRPLIDKLFSNTEYLERYHSYLQQLIDNYFANGKFGEKINALDALISDYVKNDATAFCTYEEYKTAVSAFITLGNLRAQSVQGQLDGTVPSTTEEQNKNPDKLISAGNLKLSDLGSMMSGRGGNNRRFPDRMGGQDGNFVPGGMDNDIDMELMSKVMDIIRKSNGEITDEVKEELLSIGLANEQIEQIEQFSAMDGGRFGGMVQGGMEQGEIQQRGMQQREIEQRGQNRNAPFNLDARTPQAQGARTNNIVLMGALPLVLVAAIIFAAKFKRSY